VSHPVLTYLKARQLGKAAEADGRKIALVLEGGAMRGIYLAGMLRALQAQGINASHFDMIVGSSVGVYLACYFAAGNSDRAQDIMQTEAFDSRFINLSRILTGGPVLDNGWMIDDVFFGRKPFGKIKSEQHLYAVCTRVPDGTPEIFHLDANEERTRSVLKATGSIPFIAGPPIFIGDHQYVDGGISDQIPIAEAERLGATDIVVLLTRKRTKARKHWFTAKHIIEEAALFKLYGKSVAALYRKRRERINECLDAFDLGVSKSGARLQAIYVPQGAPVIGRLTKDLAKLKAAASACFAAVEQMFAEARSGQ